MNCRSNYTITDCTLSIKKTLFWEKQYLSDHAQPSILTLCRGDILCLCDFKRPSPESAVHRAALPLPAGETLRPYRQGALPRGRHRMAARPLHRRRDTHPRPRQPLPLRRATRRQWSTRTPHQDPPTQRHLRRVSSPAGRRRGRLRPVRLHVLHA